MTKYALIAALVASLGLAGGIIYLQRSNASLEAKNAVLTRSLAEYQARAEQAALARDVEAARAAKARQDAADAQAQIETIFREIADAPLDPALADLLNGLRNP